MTDALDFIAPTDAPPQARSIPLWLRWIVGVLVAITAVAVVWTLQRPAPIPLDPGWTPLCPKLEGEWVQTCKGEEGQARASTPIVVGENVFIDAVSWDAKLPFHHDENRKKTKHELRDLSGRILHEWTGESVPELLQLNSQLLALETDAEHPVINYLSNTSPAQSWEFMPDLSPVPDTSGSLGWGMKACGDQLLLTLYPEQNASVPATLFYLVNPQTRTLTAFQKWDRGSIWWIDSSKSNPYELEFESVDSNDAPSTISLNLLTGAFTERPTPTTTLTARMQSQGIGDPKPGSHTTWPPIGVYGAPTYVRTIDAPTPDWERERFSIAGREPPVALVVESWSYSAIRSLEGAAWGLHPAAASSVARSRDLIDDMLQSREWRQPKKKIGDGWLLRSTSTGGEQLPLSRNIMSPAESLLMQCGNKGLYKAIDFTGKLVLLQMVKAPLPHLEAPSGLVRIGVPDYASGVRWCGYWPLPKAPRDDHRRPIMFLALGEKSNWVTLTLGLPQDASMESYILKLPELDALLAAPDDSSPFVQNNPGH